MKRNWDIIRNILLAVEQLPDEHSQINSDEFLDMDSVDAAWHIRIMLDAGLIEGDCSRLMGSACCYATGLTWAGAELLDHVRHEAIWDSIKQASREKCVDMSMSGIVSLARWLAEKALA